MHFSAFHYDSESRPGQQLHSQFSPGDLAVVEGQRSGKFSQNGKFGQNGKLDHVHSCVRVTRAGQKYVIVHLGLRLKCKQLHP